MTSRQKVPPLPRTMLVRAGWGTLLACRPAQVLAAVGGGAPPGRLAVPVTRALGLRQVGQAWLCRHRRDAKAYLVSAGIDALHAGSMVVLARSGRLRRAAALDAAIATCFTVSAIRAARSIEN